MKRRHFLLGGVGAIGALLVGWSALPPKQRLQATEPLENMPYRPALNGWVRIGSNNTVTITMAHVEMGQGTHTGLAMMLADELDADWAQVRLIQAPPGDKIYNNLSLLPDGLPFHPDDMGMLHRGANWMTTKASRLLPGLMLTGGSSSIKDQWQPLREAGASARLMLLAAAAKQWKVPVTECSTANSKVTHAASGRSASYGELAVSASKQALPKSVTLKTPDAFKLIGQPLKRIEAASKLNGTAQFGIDIRAPGMLYASVTMCPVLGGRFKSMDASKAQAMPGVKKVFTTEAAAGAPPAVVVIATQPWQALQALKAVQIEWDEGENANFSSAAFIDSLAQSLDQDDGYNYYEQGNVSQALSKATKRIKAEYRVPYLAHATMEPMNCTVRFKEGEAMVWAPTQIPGMVPRLVADVLGIDSDKVQLHITLLGGGFGRRLEPDFFVQAAQIAKEANGVPVQTFWTREQDMQHDKYRPACVARLEAGFDDKGQLSAWQARSAGQSVTHQIVERLFGSSGMGPDKTTAEGAYDTAYAFPSSRISHQIVPGPVPVGYWRSVGWSHQGFITESFMDEVAAELKQDPLALRLALLAEHPEHVELLKRLAELSGWGQPITPGADGVARARGVALVRSFGSIVGQVAEVSVAADKRIRVHKVTCVLNCGTAINPNLVRQQVESGIIFGLSAALYGEIKIEKGRVLQNNFYDYLPIRMNESPEIVVEIMPSQAPPEGMGEPGTPPIAPAVANAVFTLTGQRLRSLPLKLA
ncbi:MAG: xanthine dehydrogenase family protein molybdopterin-binding subunit [Thiothrix sp.]|nr:MAG: xanthine dehydrogenase family protein molybdopterin-binding subunit [Thiothrix sp.]